MSSLPEDIQDLERLPHSLAAARASAQPAPIAIRPPKDGWMDPYAAGRRIKRYTLVHVLDRKNGRCLLGRKKRGLGAGLINGFGGKLEPGESSFACAARELQEECGLSPRSMRFHGRLVFTFESALVREQGEERTPLVDLYVCDEWEGVIVETEEMAPVWTHLDKIPYDQMWEEAHLYLPSLLQAAPGAALYGRVDYAATPANEVAQVDDKKQSDGPAEEIDPQGGMRPVAWEFCWEQAGDA